MNQRITTIIILLSTVILGGVWVGYHYHDFDRLQRQGLVQYLSIVQSAINPDRIVSLAGDESDLTNPDYLRLKDQLTKMVSSYPYSRYLYLMRLVNGQVIFLVDTQSKQYTSSEAQAVPGEVYEDAESSLVDVFSSQKTITVGPETDKWGTFVSALGVIKSTDNQTVAVVGVDVDSSLWNQLALKHVSPHILLTIFILLLEVVLIRYLNRIREHQSTVEYLAQVLESSHDAVASLSLDGIIRSWNQGATQLFGYTSSEAIGKKITDLIYPKDQQKDFNEIYGPAKLGRKVINHKAIRQTKDGKKIVILLTESPIVKFNKVIGTTIVAKDITEDDQLKTGLQERNEKLEKLNNLMINRELKMIELKQKLNKQKNLP